MLLGHNSSNSTWETFISAWILAGLPHLSKLGYPVKEGDDHLSPGYHLSSPVSWLGAGRQLGGEAPCKDLGLQHLGCEGDGDHDGLRWWWCATYGDQQIKQCLRQYLWPMIREPKPRMIIATSFVMRRSIFSEIIDNLSDCQFLVF